MTDPAGFDVLAALQEAHAFDPVPLRAGVHGYHVPFDDLTGSKATEGELARAARGMERVAVAGRSGVGKTSMIQYALGTLTDKVAAIRVPVEAESDETVTEPHAFAAHLIRTVARYLHDAKMIGEREHIDALSGSARTLTLATRRTGSFGFGAQWLLRADLAREVEAAVSVDVAPSASDVVAKARDIVAVVAAHDLVPVLVIDDSDAWLATPNGDRTRLVGPFFTRVVRVLAEELNAGIVVAVHDHYFDLPGFSLDTGFLEQTIRIPRLPSAGGIAAILHARVAAHLDDKPSLDGVVTDDVVAGLFNRYKAVDGNIRTTLLAAHTALQAACEDHAHVITDRHLQVAFTRYNDTYPDVR